MMGNLNGESNFQNARTLNPILKILSPQHSSGRQDAACPAGEGNSHGGDLGESEQFLRLGLCFSVLKLYVMHENVPNKKILIGGPPKKGTLLKEKSTSHALPYR